MKIKNLILVLALVTLIAGLSLGSVSAMSINIGSNGISTPLFHSNSNHKYNTHYDSACYKSYNKKCKYYGNSELNIVIYGTDKELKNVKKVTVKVTGQKTKTIGIYRGYSGVIIPAYKSSFVKGNVKNKKVTVTVYNKNGKKNQIKNN